MTHIANFVATVQERAALIDAIADDIAGGYAAGKYDAAFFIDTLIDDGRINDSDVASLILGNDDDARINAVYRIREMVKADAVEFFTNGKGADYIDGKMGEAQAGEDADNEYIAKYGESR